MTRVQNLYEKWLQDPSIDEETKKELQSIAGQDKEIEDRFYKDLEFGTGGLRGVIGAGTNRMNLYTVGKATQALAEFALKNGGAHPSVVIAYDSRHQSPEFALEAALVLAGNGVKAYVFETLRPTPELSFAVRELKASAGIVVTASHNPPEYNGYKVYGADGGQLVPHDAEQVLANIQKIEGFDSVRKISRTEAEEKGLLEWLGGEMDEKYYTAVTSVSQHPDVIKQTSGDFRIVYTPLHGTGNKPVREALKRIGFEQVRVVKEQEQPDSNFSTVKSPNPEEREAFTLALRDAKEWDADIIVGTDPDADRMGAVVKDDKGEYFVLTGNQSGAIIVHYLLGSLKERGELPSNGVVIKTIVTSEMGAVIAESYGAKVLNTLTGFKYIGEKMTEFESTGEHQFLFGYEESYGYLAGTYARDKDAVVAAMLICEAAAYYKSQGKTLYDVLQELYRQHGFFLEKLESKTLKGKDGVEQIGRMMEDWRNNPPASIEGVEVAEVEDYSRGINGLPKENVLKFKLKDGSWFCLRPSGTEPKIKFYFAVKGTTGDEAANQLQGLVRFVLDRVEQ
ncbi:phospho-sugar mutase [Paenibacillus chitinolyticus]|uniref:phosphoglucomutase (alpha-D-glucose-1,6-bisphosphate-dependent) n=1 Tax=Paenibacillus chitinolyticus TaxID=79263 RepID=A0A410WQR9_9BACL|nr:phospho-sugar mutase [Paenibacillus chitinolyticus]MCY9591715.1 phospho-sugar mutase [Paenibacillus chitinolyticus]MCY9596074.1 phospho-sugar mutase [Paenibacillus chitinolyticus]QAV16637.1 phospho-sugar mutase [Paenibacillus chitinolyticus]